ncbi:MAG: glycosyltransferase family 2 protein, partial [Deltaproteobacteria bacterium]|nr:glycosyltransferase family 2 protein [Deltaproteobacteria bacterium]
MPGALRCSIVINTYNRAPYLEKLLLAFNRLTYDDFEVIVVNGPSTDWTAALLREYRGRIKV